VNSPDLAGDRQDTFLGAQGVEGFRGGSTVHTAHRILKHKIIDRTAAARSRSGGDPLHRGDLDHVAGR
jgi:hypothetical protein